MKIFNFFTIILVTAGLNTINLTSAAESQDIPEKSSSHSAFIAKKDGETIISEGKADERHSPFSTFKVVLALAGFDAGILKDKDSPQEPFREEYEQNLQSWYTREKGSKLNWTQDQTPKTYMKHSVVWFSHLITQRLGNERFQEYVSKLNYGNMDVSGTPGKDDGIFNSWLGTSLLISTKEQAEFLERLLNNTLDLSPEAQEKTREIMDREEDWDGWKLYGKIGGGEDGWFIGWIEKNGQRIVFSQYLDLRDGIDLTDLPTQTTVGIIAKEVVKRKIMNFLRLQDNGVSQ